MHQKTEGECRNMQNMVCSVCPVINQVVWATMMGNECFMITIYIYIYGYHIYTHTFLHFPLTLQVGIGWLQKKSFLGFPGSVASGSWLAS